MMGEYRDLEFLSECDVEASNEHVDVFIAALTVIDKLDDCPTPWRVGRDGALQLGN